jgi:hypothetical protein
MRGSDFISADFLTVFLATYFAEGEFAWLAVQVGESESW